MDGQRGRIALAVQRQNPKNRGSLARFRRGLLHIDYDQTPGLGAHLDFLRGKTRPAQLNGESFLGFQDAAAKGTHNVLLRKPPVFRSVAGGCPAMPGNFLGAPGDSGGEALFALSGIANRHLCEADSTCARIGCSAFHLQFALSDAP